MTEPFDQKISEVLREIAAKHDGERIHIGTLANDLHEQGLPLLMAVFVIPICIPIPFPPGFSTTIAICLSVFALQMFFQRESLWIPAWIARKTVNSKLVHKLIDKALPRIERVEHRFCERWLTLCSPLGERLIACITLCMNFLISIPLPGIHFFPGWAIMIMCLGLLTRDGKVIAVGFAMAAWGATFAYLELWLGETLLNKLFSL